MLGLKELDRMILSNLDDKDLVNYCRTNKAMNKICNDQTFWFNRLQSRFPQIDLEVMRKVKIGSWSDVYIEMVKFVRSVNKTYWLSKKKKEELISFQDKDTGLRAASRYGYLEMVKYLVENGADIHARNDNALREASRYGHLDIVKYLVENGADIHALNDEALRMASYNGHLDIVKFLVNNGANIHSLGNWALIMAIIKGHLEVVKFLVENGANIHDRALIEASREGHLEIIKYLVQSGADIHTRNDYVLKNARDRGDLEIVKFLKSLM